MLFVVRGGSWNNKQAPNLNTLHTERLSDQDIKVISKRDNGERTVVIIRVVPHRSTINSLKVNMIARNKAYPSLASPILVSIAKTSPYTMIV